jgi:hypothetical protein
MNFFIGLAANDYIEIMWQTSNVDVTIKAQAAQTSPTRPATPSTIATMQYVSAAGYSSNVFGGVYISSTTKGSAVITHPANTLTDKTYRYLVVG